MAAVEWTIASGEADILAEKLGAVTETVVKPIVRRKLHASLNEGDTSPRNLDAFEIVSEIQIVLLSELQKQETENAGGIRDLDGFAATVSRNLCHQYFRLKFPVRTRHKNRLRYCLTHKKGFALWKGISGNWVCGYEKWKHDETDPAAVTSQLRELECGPENYVTAISDVFDKSGKPILFDDLVQITMDAFGLMDRADISVNDEESGMGIENSLSDSRPTADEMLEFTERLRQFWDEIKRMPMSHRSAILLNLKDSRGEGMISTLPLCGIASVRQISAALELEPDEFATIWSTLPWNDLQIAEHLGVTRQQVINLRQSARARLIRMQI